MSNDYPSLPEQAKNLIETAKQVVSNPYIASEQVKQERLNTCFICDRYDDKRQRCKECGCFVRAKVIFSVNSCPIGKWNSIAVNNTKQKEINVEEIDSKNMLPERDFPDFPRGDKEPGDVYEWRNASWTWNGVKWMFNYPDGYDGPREGDV